MPSSTDNIGKQVSDFKKNRIKQLWLKEPELELWVYVERFDVAKGTLRMLFRTWRRELRKSPRTRGVAKRKVSARKRRAM